MAEEKDGASSFPTGAQVPESTTTTNPISTAEQDAFPPEELLLRNPLPSQGSEATVHQESALRMPATPPEDTHEPPRSDHGRTSASPASTEEADGAPTANNEENPTTLAAQLLRSPSVLSDGTGNRPDPPSVLSHREVVHVDYEWVHEFLPPRGGDAAETGGTTPLSRPRTTIHDDDEMRPRGPVGTPKDATPRYISVPSLDERDQVDEEDHRQMNQNHQNQNHLYPQPHDLFDAEHYDDDDDYHLNDEDHRHHLKRVESLLRDDGGGVSGSPLPSVWEHEELLVPPPLAVEVSQEEEGTTDDVWEGAVERQDPRSQPLAQAASSTKDMSPQMRESPAPSYRPTISITEARVYDAPPLVQRFTPSDANGNVDVVGDAAEVVVGAAALMPRHDDGLAVAPPRERPAPPPPPRSRRNPPPSESVDRPTRFHTHARPPTSGAAAASQHGFSQYQQASAPAPAGAPILVRGGRRKIRLRLQEETTRVSASGSAGVTTNGKGSRRSLLGHLRSKSSQMMWGSRDFKNNQLEGTGNGNNNNHLDGSSLANGAPSSYSNNGVSAGIVDRGILTVSWFDGTSAIELQEHVRTSVLRKLGLEKNVDLADMRILDDTTDPPEEIVLSPHIPDGSQFLLRYATRDRGTDGTVTPLSIYSGRAPDSPSADPSPRTGRLVGDLNANQLALLRRQLNALKLPQAKDVSVDEREVTKSYRKRSEEEKKEDVHQPPAGRSPNPNAPNGNAETLRTVDGNEEGNEGGGETPPDHPNVDDEDDLDQQSRGSKAMSELEDDYDDMMLHSEDPIEARLRQITELLILDRQKKRSKYSSHKREKRQVIFVLANYFVLFLSLIAISAEIQARAPNWLLTLESSLKNVQDCAADKDALFQCVSNGDFAGLVASILLYLSRSVATRRFFLFGFETPKKLWTVVYESLVTSVCWGFSYLFIRRGMNPDTRPQFVQKYWKEAVYGSLAGFNAAFMKHVLKNLIPQEAVEDVLRERQLKILSWLPSFHG